MPRKPIRLGIVGGQRGGAFNVALEHHKHRVVLSAVCDLDKAVLDRWKKQRPGVAVYTDFDRMLADDTCDAVFVATPMQLHASQSIAALRSGRHVISEVTACITHAEALDLIRAVESTRRVYMMAENYTYMRPHMMVLNMVRKGVFGDLTYAEGMYVHDCRGIMFNDDGSLTWRGELARDIPPSDFYPTHSLGPIAQWLDLGTSDQIDSVYCTTTPAHCMANYARRRFGPRAPGATPTYWHRGDGSLSLVKTRLGRVISLRLDSASARPHHMTSHELQGTTACYRTQPDPRDEPLVWIDGRSLGENPPTSKRARRADPRWGLPMVWDPLHVYQHEFDHPRWQRWGAVAQKAGHGGGDYFELEDFLDAIDGKPNPIDVYTAVAWSSLIWLSADSARTGKAVKAIDYRKKKR